MNISEPDQRTAERQARDEEMAAEPGLKPLELPADARGAPVETHLAVEGVGGRRRHPVAVPGVVENGLVRPLDPAVRLPERSRVIIVASEDRSRPRV